MLLKRKPVAEKRAEFRAALKGDKILKFPGAYAPIVAQLVEELGYDGVYISGAVLSNDLAMPDIGLTTLTEVTQRGRQIARATSLPAIIDVDTGFGEPMNMARTIIELDELGMSGCHLEDQINPKRCGHLDNKGIVEVDEMCRKVRAASDAKMDPNFLIIARTDSRASEGLDKAIDRAKAYVDAGAEMIFAEAMQDESEFEAFRKGVDVPILANMTEFGKSKLLDAATLESIGIDLVIYPVTTQRIAMKAVEDGLREIIEKGTQEGILDKMQTRKRLYELIRYDEYNQFDKDIYNFKMK